MQASVSPMPHGGQDRLRKYLITEYNDVFQNCKIQFRGGNGSGFTLTFSGRFGKIALPGPSGRVLVVCFKRQ